MGLHRDGDIVPNIDSTNTLPASLTFTHGTQVASVLAARGNDGQNITGMMWSARLELYDVAQYHNGAFVLNSGGNQLTDTDLLIYYANEAVIRGARVVNFSLGSNTAKSGPHTLGQDSARFRFGHAFREAAQGPNHPLWVLSAGNMGHGTDSYWQSTLGIADSLPTESIIVTGANFQRGDLSADATGAGKIDIAAPGQSVAVMDGAGVSAATGSSFATPLVSGAAGLLFAFDSTLTASEVKQLILAGASTHLAVGTIPFLDAYAALKLAARRTGAPLCGNRVYARGSQLVADRSQGAEVLGTLPAGYLQINAKHGGHRVEVNTSTASYSYTLKNGQWMSANTSIFPSPSPTDGGSYNSNQKFTHDADSIVEVRLNTNQLVLAKYDTASYTRVQISQGSTLPIPSNNSSRDCDFIEGVGSECLTYNYYRGSSIGRTDITYIAVPLDNGALVALGFDSFRETSNAVGFHTCEHQTYSTSDLCRDTRSYISTFDSLQVFRANPTTGVFTRLITRVGAAYPQDLTMSEDGSEIILRVAEVLNGDTSTERTTSPNGFEETQVFGARTCVTLSYSINPSGVVSGPTELARIVGDASCRVLGTAFSAPTFSPYRDARGAVKPPRGGSPYHDAKQRQDQRPVTPGR